MFNAPTIITQIPDISQIYEINDTQEEELLEDLDVLEDDMYVDDMSSDTLGEWEKIYKITVGDSDSLADRRLRVKGKMLETLPYSLRVVINKLNTLCSSGYELTFNEALTEMTLLIALTSKKMFTTVQDFLEETVPLNMTVDVDLLYNTYQIVGTFTHQELSTYTYQDLRDEVLS